MKKEMGKYAEEWNLRWSMGIRRQICSGNAELIGWREKETSGERKWTSLGAERCKKTACKNLRLGLFMVQKKVGFYEENNRGRGESWVRRA